MYLNVSEQKKFEFFVSWALNLNKHLKNPVDIYIIYSKNYDFTLLFNLCLCVKYLLDLKKNHIT